jgi:hypothetical protein
MNYLLEFGAKVVWADGSGFIPENAEGWVRNAGFDGYFVNCIFYADMIPLCG